MRVVLVQPHKDFTRKKTTEWKNRCSKLYLIEIFGCERKKVYTYRRHIEKIILLSGNTT